MNDYYIDIDEVHTPQQVLHVVYEEKAFLCHTPVCTSRADIEELTDFSDDDLAVMHLCFKAAGGQQKLSTDTGSPYKKGAKIKKRKEASTSDMRHYAKEFKEAKDKEYKSWEDNEVFDLVDFRTLTPLCHWTLGSNSQTSR